MAGKHSHRASQPSSIGAFTNYRSPLGKALQAQDGECYICGDELNRQQAYVVAGHAVCKTCRDIVS